MTSEKAIRMSQQVLGELAQQGRDFDASQFLAKAFDQHASEARAEQREDCTYATKRKLDSLSIHGFQAEKILGAILNATGERVMTINEGSMDFKLQSKELAGFGLAGYVQPNGTIKLIGSNRFIDKWPEEIIMNDNTFCLEDVIKGSVDEKTGIQFQNAEYC